MQTLEQTIYTAKATTTGGREGVSESNDGRLNIKLSTPKELGGAGGDGTNPEQLFAAGYSACFIGALKHVAMTEQLQLSNNINVTGEVSIGSIPQGFGIAVKLTVDLVDLDKDKAQELVTKAHMVCPYSNATRNNIVVDFEVV